MKSYYVYIMTNKNNTVLYTGMTNNIKRRVAEHQSKINDGFTCKYNVNKLVYFERYSYVMTAIRREKQIKDFSRQRKIELIREKNPMFEDLLLPTVPSDSQ